MLTRNMGKKLIGHRQYSKQSTEKPYFRIQTYILVQILSAIFSNFQPVTSTFYSVSAFIMALIMPWYQGNMGFQGEISDYGATLSKC